MSLFNMSEDRDCEEEKNNKECSVRIKFPSDRQRVNLNKLFRFKEILGDIFRFAAGSCLVGHISKGLVINCATQFVEDSGQKGKVCKYIATDNRGTDGR